MLWYIVRSYFWLLSEIIVPNILRLAKDWNRMLRVADRPLLRCAFWATFFFHQVMNYGHLSTTSLFFKILRVNPIAPKDLANGSQVPLPTGVSTCQLGRTWLGQSMYIISLSVLKGHCRNPSGQWAVMITTTASVRCVSGVTVIVGIVTLGPVHSPQFCATCAPPYVHSYVQFCTVFNPYNLCALGYKQALPTIV